MKIVTKPATIITKAVKKDGKYGRVFINVWSVKSVVPIEDDLFVKDIYDDEHDGFAKYKRR